MPIQQYEKEIKLAVDELIKLISFAKKIKLPRQALINLAPKLGKLELMVLDSAFKELDLLKLRNTILILPEQYIDMIHNVTLHLVHLINSL